MNSVRLLEKKKTIPQNFKNKNKFSYLQKAVYTREEILGMRDAMGPELLKTLPLDYPDHALHILDPAVAPRTNVDFLSLVHFSPLNPIRAFYMLDYFWS